MYILGITGLYCSGKSIASNYFVKKGFYEIDVDKLGHLALEVKKDDIVKEFGEHIVDNDQISRIKLGQIVFSDTQKLAKLESIVHPFMVDKVKSLIKENHSHEFIIINAALLFHMGLDKLCTEIMAVVSPLDVIIKRGIERDNITEEEIMKRLKKQNKYNENFKNAEYYIVNEDKYDDFMSNLNIVLTKIKETNDGK